jgi:putative effector of murein hydrolase LrgA (UPF0299 family)
MKVIEAMVCIATTVLVKANAVYAAYFLELGSWIESRFSPCFPCPIFCSVACLILIFIMLHSKVIQMTIMHAMTCV